MISREVKKAEAVKRMRMLGISNNTIGQFERDDVVMVSEPNDVGFGAFGALYWLDDDDQKMVAEFEAENNALVYMVVRSFTNFGKMDALLYVSDYKDEWEMDNEDVQYMTPMSYVVNHDYPYCSEFGSISVVSAGGGLVRRF